MVVLCSEGKQPQPQTERVTIMSKIQLRRIVETKLVRRNGNDCIEQVVRGVGVSFTGPDGRVVSLAFDGRCDRENHVCDMVSETYETYADCPVIDADERQSGPMPDIQAMRVLRDALIKMDLGDYDPNRVCAECGVSFVPDSPTGCSFCPACND
jgi:hypothetical protein